MTRFAAIFTAFISLAASASAAPIQHAKRIAQTTIDAPKKWEDSCDAAGGGQQCNAIAVDAAATLLAAADVCAQQNSADKMISLGKQLNSQDMITAAQIFAQQPRNSPNSVATPYCQTAPQNEELNGLFQCQFQGANQNKFANGQQLGGDGTIPFGLSAPVSPSGSCPANPSGPIADGTQLSDTATSPGTPTSTTSRPTSSSNSTTTSGSLSPGDNGVSGSASSGDSSDSSSAANSSTTAGAANATASSTASDAGSSSSSSFQLQNGKDAQQLNAMFATLTAGSSCTTEGQAVCINGGFSMCSNGQFTEPQQCAGGLQCFALPLVNSAGTSVTCDSEDDAAARIAATGATGGVDGSGSDTSNTGTVTSSADTPASTGSASTSSSSVANNAASTGSSLSSSPSSSSNSGSDFRLQNGKDAQQLNAMFATLTAGSSCTTEGQAVCINGGVSKCDNGKFTDPQMCAGGLQCIALPLVNSAGTSVTCDTAADAATRIADTGATGGINGSS